MERRGVCLPDPMWLGFAEFTGSRQGMEGCGFLWHTRSWELDIGGKPADLADGVGFGALGQQSAPYILIKGEDDGAPLAPAPGYMT